MKKIISFLVLAILLALPQAANAQLKVDVTQGKVSSFPIALTRLDTSTIAESIIAKDIIEVVQSDLQMSGLFKPVAPDRFGNIKTDIGITPLFSDWRKYDVQGLVIGRLTEDRQGQVVVEFRLWDVLAGEQMVGRRLVTPRTNWRQLAHMISDTIYNRITGEQGYFNTRTVYISERGAANRRVKRLAIMDLDGANHRYLTDGTYLVLTPRFSPNQQMVTFMSFERGRPEVYLYELNTGRKTLLGNFPGMTFAPRFSPDGNKVIMSLARGGNTDIYTMDLTSKRLNRVTSGRGIETSPSYAPDGRQIVFESDSGGNQQLYTMNTDGSAIRRITFGNGRYANPVWSPRGDLIAFTRMYKGEFYIGVIRPDGTGERLITKAYHVEGPTWAPNGRVLMYFKEKPVGRDGREKQVRIYSIDLTGSNERMLETPGDGSDPAWSPSLG